MTLGRNLPSPQNHGNASYGTDKSFFFFPPLEPKIAISSAPSTSAQELSTLPRHIHGSLDAGESGAALGASLGAVLSLTWGF